MIAARYPLLCLLFTTIIFMKRKHVIFAFSFFLLLNAVSAQEKYIVIPLRVKIDSSLYMFMGIQPGKSIDFARVPDTLLGIYTLSRYLDLKSINRKIPVLTGVSKDGRGPSPDSLITCKSFCFMNSFLHK